MMTMMSAPPPVEIPPKEARFELGGLCLGRLGAHVCHSDQWTAAWSFGEGENRYHHARFDDIVVCSVLCVVDAGLCTCMRACF